MRIERGRGVSCNDVHSRLNLSEARQTVVVSSIAEVIETLSRARRRNWPVAIAGGCHAMGGQQFRDGGLVLDVRGLKRVLGLDTETGLLRVEAGIAWPDLIRGYMKLQTGSLQHESRHNGGSIRWGIRQKQTGADRLTVGGALASNIHGRGLRLPPFIGDVESFELIDARGSLIRCSRSENPELFRLAIGGYGLFGVVVSATLRLAPREKVRRVVKLLDVEQLPEAFAERIRDGYTYGDFQFCTSPDGSDFLRRGVFSCYQPVSPRTRIPDEQLRLSAANWERLLYLAHRDKRAAFREFSEFYLASSGQIYWSDTHQLNLYLEDYHEALDERLGAGIPSSEMITELYVPRDRLPAFMDDVRRDFVSNRVDLVYGTIRLIERDGESFMPWARQDYACVIFNLHVEHEAARIAPVRDTFVRLIDHAIGHGGSYFLTYHRYARRDQLLKCYPEFPEMLRRKCHYDPDELFASDWYRHCRTLVEAS